MDLCFLLVALLIFQAITVGHPLDSTDQLVDSNSLGPWDNWDSSSGQLLAGAPGGNSLLDSSGTAGYDLFAPDSSGNPSGIENDLESSSVSNDLVLANTDYTDGSTDVTLDAGGYGDNLAENPGCPAQARKRDGSDDVLLGKFIMSNGPC